MSDDQKPFDYDAWSLRAGLEGVLSGHLRSDAGQMLISGLVQEMEDTIRGRVQDASISGLKAATAAYVAMLTLPHDKWRHDHQHVYIALRDFIAFASGRSAEEVQAEAEREAVNSVGTPASNASNADQRGPA